MGFLGIGDDSRMMLDVPANLAPRLGLPKGQNKVNIIIPNNKDPENYVIKEVLMKYGVAFQNAKNIVGAGSEKKPYKILTDSSDPGWKDFRLDDSLTLGGEERTPESVAEMRGRTGMPTGVGSPFDQNRTWGPFANLGTEEKFRDRPWGFSTEEGLGEGGLGLIGGAEDPFAADLGSEFKGSESIESALAKMEAEYERRASEEEQRRAEREAEQELIRQQNAANAESAIQQQVEEAQRRFEQQQEQQRIENETREAELRARLEEMQNDPNSMFAAEEGLGGERVIDPNTGEMRESAIGGQVTDKGVVGTQAQSLDQALETQRAADDAALSQFPAVGMPAGDGTQNFGEFTPFDIEEGGTGIGGGTGIKEMLNIFNQDPERYFVTQTIFDPVTGEAVGTEQKLSPIAEAALQAFSTQRGAEAMETGARFGAGTPFGVIAGMGGETAAADAKGLAEQQAYSGITSPFAALQTGGNIDQISKILRGGLSATQQSNLAGLQARGGISADEQRQLAGLQARGGLGVEDQFALAGMQARGGLSPEQMQALAGLQARGGLTPQQRYAEQRLAMMPSLLQMSPQSLGGFSEVFGGPEALQEYLSPFFQQPDFAAQGAAPAVDWGAQQALTRPAPATGTPMEPYVDPNEWGTGGVPVSAGRGGGVPISAGGGVPISATAGRNVPIAAGGMQTNENIARGSTAIPTRQTLGGYRKETPFARGGTQAKAAIAGKELEDYLGEVTPFGGTTRRGGFGSSVSDRFTY